MKTKHMTPSGRKINILWLDDMLEQEPAWFGRLEAYVASQHPRVQFIKTTRVERFACELEARHACEPGDDGYVDWIWLDVMIKQFTQKPTFEALGFPGVAQKATAAGAQILGLMQNAEYRDDQAHWLQRYHLRRTSLVSTILDVRTDWKPYVDSSAREMENVFSAFAKNMVYGTNVIEPGTELKDHLKNRLAQIESALAALTAVPMGEVNL